MNSREYFSQLTYLREAYVSAKKEYEKALRYDFDKDGDLAAPHMLRASTLISEALERLADDRNFYEGLQVYVDDVQNNYPDVEIVLSDLAEFLHIEYQILIQEKFAPRESIELIQSLAINMEHIKNLRDPNEIPRLRQGLTRASRAIKAVRGDINRNMNEPESLTKSIIRAARPLAGGIGILGGGLIILINSTAVVPSMGTTLVSISSGIISVSGGLALFGRN